MSKEYIRQLRAKWIRTKAYKKVPFNQYLSTKANH